MGLPKVLPQIPYKKSSKSRRSIKIEDVALFDEEIEESEENEVVEEKEKVEEKEEEEVEEKEEKEEKEE